MNGLCYAFHFRRFLLMRPFTVWCAFIGLATMPLASQAPPPMADSIRQQLPSLAETYKHLHRNPELSHHEEKTSAFLANELRQIGYTVTEHVGKYQDGSQAYGIVAVLQNGDNTVGLNRPEIGRA